MAVELMVKEAFLLFDKYLKEEEKKETKKQLAMSESLSENRIDEYEKLTDHLYYQVRHVGARARLQCKLPASS